MSLSLSLSSTLATLPEVLGPLVDLAAVGALAEHLRGVLSPPVVEQGILALELGNNFVSSSNYKIYSLNVIS